MWFNGLRCGDCENLDKSDRNKYGEAYCPMEREYVALDSYTCREFIPNFYVMTVYCNIKGIAYDSELMTTLIGFRNNYMMNNNDGVEFLSEYEGIGPILASKLSRDMYRTDILSSMEDEYVNPIIDFINTSEFEEAQNAYIQMIEGLKIRYGYAPINNQKIKRL